MADLTVDATAVVKGAAASQSGGRGRRNDHRGRASLQELRSALPCYCGHKHSRGGCWDCDKRRECWPNRQLCHPGTADILGHSYRWLVVLSVSDDWEDLPRSRFDYR